MLSGFERETPSTTIKNKDKTKPKQKKPPKQNKDNNKTKPTKKPKQTNKPHTHKPNQKMEINLKRKKKPAE